MASLAAVSTTDPTLVHHEKQALTGPAVGMRGRPNDWKDEYLDKAREYFDDPEIAGDKIPTMAGLVCYLGLSGRQRVHDYAEMVPEFRDVVFGRGKQQLERQITNRLVDRATFTQGTVFVAKNLLGWSDRSESQLETAASSLIQALAGSVAHGSLPLASRGTLDVQAQLVDPEALPAPAEQVDSDSGSEQVLTTDPDQA